MEEFGRLRQRPVRTRRFVQSPAGTSTRPDAVGERLSLRRGGALVFEEEAQHLPRGVRPSRIGVGASGTASRPSVAGSMDVPVLKDCPPARVGMDSAGICMSSRCPTAIYFLLQLRSPLLCNDMIAVARMHCVVLIPMKNDGRDIRPVPQNRRHVAGHERS